MTSGKPARFLASLALATSLTALAAGLAQAQETNLRMWTFLNPEGASGREQALASIIEGFDIRSRQPRHPRPGRAAGLGPTHPEIPRRARSGLGAGCDLG